VLIALTALLGAAVALLWGVSFPCHIGYNPAPTSWWVFSVANGALIIEHAHPARLPLSGFSFRWFDPAWQAALTPHLEREPDRTLPAYELWGYTFPASTVRGYTFLMIPIWPFVLLFAAGAGLLWRRRYKGRPPGHCVCGYDLTGNVSGRCAHCEAKAYLRGGLAADAPAAGELTSIDYSDTAPDVRISP
jgi:hypothetical protein